MPRGSQRSNGPCRLLLGRGRRAVLLVLLAQRDEENLALLRGCSLWRWRRVRSAARRGSVLARGSLVLFPASHHGHPAMMAGEIVHQTDFVLNNVSDTYSRAAIVSDKLNFGLKTGSDTL